MAPGPRHCKTVLTAPVGIEILRFMNTPARRFRVVALLSGIVLLATASLAIAAGKLDGSYSGSYTAKTDSPFVIGAKAPGNVKFKTLSRGAAAKMVISGTDADGKTPFTATFNFKSDGSVHTDAIVPGVANKKGDGTWSISSNKKVLTMDLTSSEQVTIKFVTFQTGKLSTHATIRVKGPTNKFSIKGTAQGQSNLGTVTGHYKFR